MGKYWQIYKMKVAQTMMYRGAIVIYRLGNILSIGAVIAVWLATGTGSTLGGFTKDELITYYIIALVLQGWIYWFPTIVIKEEIIQGDINAKVLVKPITYFWQKFTEELGWHTISPLFALIPAIVLGIFFRSQFIFTLDPGILVLVVLSAFFAACICFGMSYNLGILSFWFQEVVELTHVMWMGVALLGGQLIPISFFPEGVRGILNVLPFRLMFSFPMEIYLGKIGGIPLLAGFLFQMLWVLLLFSVAKMLWRRGLRVYSAYGG